MSIDHAKAERSVRLLLDALGLPELPAGMTGTPGRVARSWTERLSGYGVDVPALLAVQFDAPADPGLILLRQIDFTSTCEHHLLPFAGVAHVAYIPDGGRVVGLSKLARLVDAFARRFQIQERIGSQVVEALEEHIKPLGSACILEARHGCMTCRGVRLLRPVMVTSSVRGVFMDDPSARAELLQTINLSGGPL